MNLPLIILIVWLGSAPLSYLSLRRILRAESPSWTRIDRLYALGMSVVYGPVMLLAVAGIALFVKLHTTDWAKREARW